MKEKSCDARANDTQKKNSQTLDTYKYHVLCGIKNFFLFFVNNSPIGIKKSRDKNFCKTFYIRCLHTWHIVREFEISRLKTVSSKKIFFRRNHKGGPL